MTNIVTAAFGASKAVQTRPLHQWDYGQVLQFKGIDLPDAYTVHFSNDGVGGTAKTQVGNADGVDIPNEYLTTGQPVYAWVFLHASEDDGETVYSVTIPVTARPRPTEDAPTPQQQGLIDQAIAALNAGVEDVQEAVEGVQDAIDTALQEAKDSGEFDGNDGVSPTVDVTEITGGHRVSITDADGTENFDVPNGDPGAPGISPTITVTDITGGHRVTITDATGPHSFDVMDGDAADAPVQDVQVNGVSVLQDGVANVPIAGNAVLGAVKIGSASNGIEIDSSGYIKPASVNASDTKAGTNNRKPITAAFQHQSTFYGLTKAAGVDMASSSNPVGTYTDEAKVAIREMLGLPRYVDWELINDITVAEDTSQIDVATDSNGQPFELRKLMAIFSAGPSTTGTRDGFYQLIKYTNSDGGEASTSLPSLTYKTATSSMLARTTIEANDGAPLEAYSVTAAGDGNTQNTTSMAKQLIAKSITYLCIYQSGTTKSLIPAGANLKIYGIRA